MTDIINPEYFAPPDPDPGSPPCPFCGGEPELYRPTPRKFAVRCHRCRASTFAFLLAADARSFWARRHGGITDLRAEVERLTRLNEDKFAHLQGYCKAADEDRATIARLRAALAEIGETARCGRQAPSYHTELIFATIESDVLAALDEAGKGGCFVNRASVQAVPACCLICRAEVLARETARGVEFEILELLAPPGVPAYLVTHGCWIDDEEDLRMYPLRPGDLS